MNNTSNKGFANMIFWLRLAGIDLSPNRKKGNYRYYSIFVFTMVYTCTLSLIITAFKVDTNSNLFIFTLGCGIPTFFGTLRISAMLYNQEKLRNLLIKLEKQTILPERLKISVSEIEEIHDHVFKISMRMSNSVVGFISSAMILFATISIRARLMLPKEKWNSPFAVPFQVFDIHRSPNYEIAAFYLCISMIYCSFLYTYGDAVMNIVTAHVVKHLKILQYFLRHLCLEKYEDIPPEERVYRYLVDTIKYHLAIIEMVHEIEDALNLPIMFTFLGNVVALALSLYSLTAVSVYMDANYWFAFLYIVFAISEMGLFCYWGDEVSIQSQNLVRAAWEFRWISEEVQIRKTLVLIMARARKPLTLTAGKFSVLSMELFISIMRATFSYFTILNNSKQE